MIIEASSIALASAPAQAQRGLDLNGFCRYRYGSRSYAQLVSHDAGGWRCRVRNQLRPFSGNGYDMNAACEWQYPPRRITPAEFARAYARNWSDPYSWYCTTMSGP